MSGNVTTPNTAAVNAIHAIGARAICFPSWGRACTLAGFDGVEWDNVDGYANRTGGRCTGRPSFRLFTIWIPLACLGGGG